MKMWWLGKAAKIVGLVAVAAGALGFVVMMLWNGLIPELFKGPEITFWQSVGLLILAHILLRGGPWRHAHGWRHERWRQKWEEKLAAMTPEEREKIRAEWGRKCWPGYDEPGVTSKA